MPQMGMMDPAQMQAMMMGMMNGMPGMNGMNGAQNGMNGMNGMNGAKPLNPRHFDRFEGGRKRVSDTFTHKNSGSCTWRSTTTVSCTILA